MKRILTVALHDLVDHPLDYIKVEKIGIRTFGKIENISEFKNSAGKGHVHKVHNIALGNNQQEAPIINHSSC